MIESYTEEQARTLYRVGVPFAVISMIGCILVFILFYKMYGEEHSQTQSPSLAQRFQAIKPIHEFVLLIAVFNLIGAIGNVLGVGYPYQSNVALCKSRQIVAVFGGWTSFQLSWVMSYIMYMTIFYPQNTLYLNLLIDVKTRRIIEMIIVSIGLIIALSPFNLYCSKDAHNARMIFYIPMMITWVFISFCYLSIIYYFKTGGVVDEKDMRIYRNIRLYPGIMLFCLSTGTIRRLYNIANDGYEPPFVFAVIQIIAMYSYGAIISAVYFYNVKVNNQKTDDDPGANEPEIVETEVTVTNA